MSANSNFQKISLKFVFSIILLGLFNNEVSAQKAQLTIIREFSYYESMNEMLIFVDKKPIVILPVNTYLTKDFDEGTYTLSVMGLEKGKLQVDLIEDEHKYFLLSIKPGFFTVNYSLIPVDSVYAKSAIKTKGIRKILESEALPDRQKSRFGINLGAGIGLKNIDMLMSTEGDDSSISFGGGLQIGAEYGTELSTKVDLAIQANYMMASLAPPLKNADIDFSRFHLAFRPSLIIPFYGGFKSRLKIGPGLDYYFAATMSLETNKIDGGFNGDWNYSNNLGWHLALIYEYNINRNFMYTFGLRYSVAKYTYENSTSNNIPIHNDLINGNGNSIDFMMGFFKTF